MDNEFVKTIWKDKEADPATGTELIKVVETREVAVFLFLIVPSMVLSFFAVKQGTLNFPLVAFATIFRDLAMVALVLFFLWRNGEPVSQIGWNVKNGWSEVVWGGILFIPLFISASLLEKGLQSLGFSVPATPSPFSTATSGPFDILLAFLLVAIVAFSEETIFRGYLILRFRNINDSPLRAVFFSSVIFSLGHGYEGSAGVITVGYLGLVFGLVYLWRRSLLAPMTIHFLQDFGSILVFPFLSGH
jgi:membrane protease YdiL (CAAX protease family)